MYRCPICEWVWCKYNDGQRRKTDYSAHISVPQPVCTANNFGLMCSRRISQNSFPNLIYIIPKSFVVFWQELHNPKRNYKTRFEPRLPRMSSWKSNIHNILILNSNTLASQAGTSILPLDHQSCYIDLQSCPCQDPNWGNKSAKPVKVTGKNDSPWLSWMELIILFWNSCVGFWTEVWLIPFGIM